MKVKWQGVYPALLTMFKKNGKLDLDMYSTNVKAQIKAGVDGLIIGGSLGEASTLLRKEKMELLKTTRKLAKGRVPVILNIAERSTKVAVSIAEEAEAKGADGLMVLPPMQYKATEQEVVDYFLDIAKATSLPILLYNNPVDYKIEITLDMLDVLLDHENIQAIKESTRDVSNVSRIINRFGPHPLKILCGVDTLAMEELLMGAHGWVAGLVDAFPAETVAIYRLVKAGKIEEARQIYRWFLPILELDISPQLVQNIKLAASMTGIGTEHVRPPRKPLSGEERQRVAAIVEQGLKKRPILPPLPAS
jgi:4-hydroxy-tetrahydrodipicolinate synthase